MRNLLWVPAAVLFLFLVGIALPDPVSPKPEGDQPYTPTSLEWMVVELNSWTGFGVEADFGGVGVNFEARPTTNTVTIWIRHAPDADPENIKKFTQMTRKTVEDCAKEHGWSDWLQIQVR